MAAPVAKTVPSATLELTEQGDQGKYLDFIKQLCLTLSPIDQHKKSIYILNTIIEVLKKNAQHQPKSSILYEALYSFLDQGLFDVNIVVTELVKSLELVSFPQLWPPICELIQTNIYRVSIESAKIVLEEVLKKLQAAPLTISPLKQDLSMSQYILPLSNLQYFDSAQCGVRLLCRYFQDKAILPPYHLISITQQILTPPHHWILQPFTDIILQHKQNLANLLIPSGRFERYRIPSMQRESLHTQLRIHPSHQIIDKSTAGIEKEGQDNEMWRRGVRTIASMLYDQIPISAILYRVINTEFESIPIHISSNQPVQVPRNSQLLLEATVLRAEQLVAFTEYKMNKLDAKDIHSLFLEEIYEGWWGEWHRFGFQFYTFVEERAVDFEKFVLKVADLRLKDNGLIWLLCQCLMIERLKDYFMTDIFERKGWITSKVLSFRNEYHSKTSIPIRDTAVQCFIHRVRALISEASKPKNLSQYLVNDAIPPSFKFNEYDLEKRRQWWVKQKEAEKKSLAGAQPTINFYQPGDDQISICLLSNLSSDPIAKQIQSFLMTSSVTGKFARDISFIGRSKPLSIHLLSCLSIKANQRLLYDIEKGLFNEVANVNKESPALVETYIRLLYTAPESRYKLQYNLSHPNTSEEKLHLFVEMINFRLMRCFRFNQATNRLVLDVHKTLMKTDHYQLYKATENLFIKAALYQSELSTFHGISSLDFGITANRLFFFTIVRTMKLRGVSDYSTLELKIPPLSYQLLQLTGASPWQKRKFFFPSSIKAILEQVERIVPAKVPVVSKQNVLLYMNAPLHPDSIQMVYFLPASIFILHKMQHDASLHKPLMAWLDAGKKQLSLINPRLRAQWTYDFVDFLLDECMISNHAKELLELGTTITSFGKRLETLIWRLHLLSFERVLWALMDRCGDDLNAISLLEYFLTVSSDTQRVIHDFLDQNLNPQSWKEPDYFKKMSDYMRSNDTVNSYSLSQFMNLSQPLFPIYYGALPLRLLPIIDCAIMIFIETGRTEVICDMFAEPDRTLKAPKLSISFIRLYHYHEGPVIFVKELFHYYYHSKHLTSSCKQDLLSLVKCNPLVRLSPDLAILRASITHNIFPTHGSNLIQRFIVVPLSLATNNAQGHPSQQNVPFRAYQEFPTESERVLTTCIIELLLFEPRYIPQLVASILQPLLGYSSGLPTLMAALPTPLPFPLLHAMGLLLACLPGPFSTGDVAEQEFFVSPLPRPFAEELFQHCFTILSCDDLFSFTRPFGSNPFSSFGYVDSGNKMDPFLTNKSNALITVMHSFFTHSGIDKVDSFVELFDVWLPQDESTPFMSSYHQLYVFCRIVAPWVYRLSHSTNVICKLIYFILRALSCVDKKSRASLFLVQCDIAESSTNANTISWLQGVIVDFLFHLNHLNPSVMSNPQHQINVTSTIGELSPQIKSKFHCFSHNVT